MQEGVTSPRPFLLARLGLTDYREALELQRSIALRRTEGALSDTLLLLEHPHIYTLGRRARRSDVLLDDESLGRLGIAAYRVDRGGEVTYHGPGQLVGYPVLDLRPLGGVARYVRTLELVITETLLEYGLEPHRGRGPAGVWVGGEKVAAIGVRVSRGITTHGFALNVGTDLSYFQHIVPCGVPGGAVTSMERLLGRAVPLGEVESRIAGHFGSLFNRYVQEVAPEVLLGPVTSPGRS